MSLTTETVSSTEKVLLYVVKRTNNKFRIKIAKIQFKKWGQYSPNGRLYNEDNDDE